MRQWISNLARRFRPSASAIPAGNAVEGLEDRRLMASSLSYGINVNGLTSGTYPKIVKMLNDTGTRTIRLWMGISSYSKNETGVFKYIRKFHSAGFDTTVTVVPKGLSSSDTVRDYFKWAAGTLGGSVNRWQIGNEVDKRYSAGTYVNKLLAPAAAGLHDRGEKVVSGSVSWNPQDVKEMVDAGMLKYVDFVGYHPYRNSVEDLAKCVSLVKSYVGGKPLIATEWNVRGDEGNKDLWNDEIKDFWPVIRDNFYAAYYFAAIKVGTLAGPGAVMTKSGSANGEFYSTYKGLKGNFSSSPVTSPSNPAAPRPVTPPVGSNVPDTAGKPTVGGFRVFDAVTGDVIKGYENVSGSLTIRLGSLAHRQIQIRALVSTSTQSVKFGFTGRGTRTENTAPFTVFGDKSNKATAWTAVKGKYTLTATAHAADNAQGSTGAALSLILNFV